MDRLNFTVEETEAKCPVNVAGLRLHLRLDRVDVTENGGRLVIDYKTGDLGPKQWMDDRPEDVQLPLYATYGVRDKLEGLLFARLRPGDLSFCGRVRDARRSLLPSLNGRDGLVKDPLTDEQVNEWRELIEALGRDFVEGKAAVDPREPGKTCERCHLHGVCRIAENDPESALAGLEEVGNEGGAGESYE
jgi:RecB family exonuclease